MEGSLKGKTTLKTEWELQVLKKNKNINGLHSVPIKKEFLESLQPFSPSAQPLALCFFKQLQKPRDIVSCGLLDSPVVGVSQKLPDMRNLKEGWCSAKEGVVGEERKKRAERSEALWKGGKWS